MHPGPVVRPSGASLAASSRCRTPRPTATTATHSRSRRAVPVRAGISGDGRGGQSRGRAGRRDSDVRRSAEPEVAGQNAPSRTENRVRTDRITASMCISRKAKTTPGSFKRGPTADDQSGYRQMEETGWRGRYPLSTGSFARTRCDEREGLPGPIWDSRRPDGSVARLQRVRRVDHHRIPTPPSCLPLITSAEGMAIHARGRGPGVPTRKDVAHPWVHDYQVPREGVDYLRLY